MSARMKGNSVVCPVYLVYLVLSGLFDSLVCLVCLMNSTNQMNKTNQINQTDLTDRIDQTDEIDQMLVVDFNTDWWIATTGASVASRQDTSLLGNLGHCRMAMLAQALRFICDKRR